MAKNKKNKKSSGDGYGDIEEGAGLPRARQAKRQANINLKYGGFSSGRSTIPGGQMFSADAQTVAALSRVNAAVAEVNAAARNRAKPKIKKK